MMDDDVEKFKAQLKGLVYVFEKDLKGGTKLKSEEDVKSAVIEPFLKIAGWNVSNPDEVKKELPVEGGKVDYALIIEDEIRVIIEAKSIDKDLEKGFDMTKGKGKRTYEEQAINYAYSNGVKWVLLTNGKEWRLYNAYWQGTNKDRLAYIIDIGKFEENARKLALLRRETVAEGQLDNRLKHRPMRKPVDVEVVEFLLESRKALTNSVYENNKGRFDIATLRGGIQRILDRLVFFKICEDRDISDFGRLRDTFTFFTEKMLSKDSFVQGLKVYFRDFDNVYNGEMFAPHPCEDFVVSNDVYERIITGLYEYDFATINVDILGRIYENYLGNTLQEIEERGLEWITDPKERKKYGQYYTPQYVVDYIVSNIGLTKDSKVLDPACGSGAFLIKAYDRLKELYEEYNEEQRKKAQNGKIATDVRMVKNVNSEILKRNLYGVDLNPEAVELTKINLWLRSIQKNTKLNNLDSNIMCGNSLISGAEEELKEYFEDPTEKRPFNWDKKFEEVREAGGFDGIIGNPPYVQMQKRAEEQKYCGVFYPEIYSGQNDLLYYFVLKGLQVLRNNGTLGYITSRYFFESAYAKKFRDYILQNAKIKQIIDFKNVQLFGYVNVLTVIIILEKEESENARKNNQIKVVNVKSWKNDHQKLFELINKNIELEEHIDKNIEVFNVLQGTLTSESWAFKPQITTALLDKLRQNAWELGELCDIGQGMTTGLNEIFIVDNETMGRHNIENDVLKRYVKTQDIKRYQILYRDLFMIYSIDIDIGKYPNLKSYLENSRGTLENRYEFTKGNCKWFEIAQARNKELFDNSKEKIFIPTYSTSNKFAYDPCDENSRYYGMTDTYIIVPKEKISINLKFILTLLNSTMMEFYHHNTAKLKRDGYYEYVTGPLSKLPICKIDLSNPKEKAVHDELVGLADKMSKLYEKLSTINTDFNRYLHLKTTIGESELRDFLDTLDVVDKEVLNDANSLKANIKRIDIEKQGDWLVFKINAVLDRGSKFENVEVLKCRFADRTLREFIYHCIKNLKKKRLGNDFVLQKLRRIPLPKFSSNSEENRASINELMGKYLKAVDEKQRIEKEIEETDRAIDRNVYELYGLTEEEIKIMEGAT